MTHGVMIRRATTALAAIAGVLATGASSASATSAVNAATATCTAPALAQPFSSASDTNWYAPLPGESWNSFPATGWTLSRGAKVVSTTLADGTTRYDARSACRRAGRQPGDVRHERRPERPR